MKINAPETRARRAIQNSRKRYGNKGVQRRQICIRIKKVLHLHHQTTNTHHTMTTQTKTTSSPATENVPFLERPENKLIARYLAIEHPADTQLLVYIHGGTWTSETNYTLNSTPATK